MNKTSINRTLWYENGERRLTLSQSELRQQTRPLVILGEPGIGKTHLLEWLAAAPGYTFCSARKLINRHDPRTLLRDARVLVIDALDEVSTQKDGEAVDLVLRRLGELAYPRFVLSCRVADWRSATGMEAIREQYESEDSPFELHLDPFNDNDAIAFLADRVGAKRAESIVNHFHSRGLSGFLGNPQTLELITNVADQGALPENRGELFERAVTVLRIETRDAKADAQLASETALDAAGAAFAALILTGNEAIVRKAEANNAEGEILMAEICQLPGGEAIGDVIGTRLFKSSGADRFGYWHRRIGEYLGARWLVKLALTDRKRRRILSFFQSHDLVPASLRGMHAWLAQDAEFAAQAIAKDPMGIIEYGDADNLTNEQGRLLLLALQKLAATNPDFHGWGTYAIQGIVRPALVEDVRRLLADTDTSSGLQILLLEALRTAPTASHLETELHALFLNQKVVFAVRRRAADVLAGLGIAQDWQTLLSTLLIQGDELTLRLAIEVMDKVGYQHFTEELVFNLIISFAKCSSHTIGVLSSTKKHLPDTHLEDMLNRYAEAAKAMQDALDYQGKQELSDFVYYLITRRLEIGSVVPAKLWLWLQHCGEFGTGYDKETQGKLAQLIRDNTCLRREVLYHVLLEQTDGKTVREQYWHLVESSAGFEPTPDDIIFLMAKLNPSEPQDDRWRDLVQLTQHDENRGAEVRAAAYQFTANRPEQIAWIDDLTKPYVPEWQIKQSQREQARLLQQAQEHAEERKKFMGLLDSIRQGVFGSVINLAMGYLGLFHDIGDKDVPAHVRLSQWLGEEIDNAAKVGFETFFLAEPLHPGADEIVASFVQGMQWDAGYIFVAALAERYRKEIGFSDLDNERLLAGLFVLLRTKIDNQAGIQGLEDAIAKEVKNRGLWANAMRRYFEPQLQIRQTYVDGLLALMHDGSAEQLASDLAKEWLIRFTDLPADPESQLIDRLIRSERFSDLKSLYSARLDPSDTAHRLNWTAIGLLVDFDVMVATLAKAPVEQELLWHIRDRANGGDRNHLMTLSIEQLEWIIAMFRTFWPMTGYPNHIRHGDKNAWDASDFLRTLVRRLGTDSGAAATTALHQLADTTPDGYTPIIRSVAAEQERLRVESTYAPPTLAAIEAIARDRAPCDVCDLKVFMLEEIAVVQNKIKSDDTDSWHGFFDDAGIPYGEERCRDHLLGLLRQGSSGVTFEPEAHVADDKEVDITCTSGQFRLPIEVKGQWHSKLWQAADTQLDKLYAQDWRAGGCGIYLVLWFGENVPTNKTLYRPRRGVPIPSTHQQLRDMLASCSKAARDGGVSIIVLDLERPSGEHLHQ